MTSLTAHTLPPGLIPLPDAWRPGKKSGSVEYSVEPRALERLTRAHRQTTRPQASISDFEDLRDQLNALLLSKPAVHEGRVLDQSRAVAQVTRCHTYFCRVAYTRLLALCQTELKETWKQFHPGGEPNSELRAFVVLGLGSVLPTPSRGAIGHLLPHYTVASTADQDLVLFVTPCWVQELLSMFYAAPHSAWTVPPVVLPSTQCSVDEIDVLRGLWSADSSDDFFDPWAVLQAARLLV